MFVTRNVIRGILSENKHCIYIYMCFVYVKIQPDV